MSIFSEAHNVLLDNGEGMVERCKVRKFLDGIDFGPMDLGKAKRLAHP